MISSCVYMRLLRRAGLPKQTTGLTAINSVLNIFYEPEICTFISNFHGCNPQNCSQRCFKIEIGWKNLIYNNIFVRDEPIPEKNRFADPIYRSRYKKIIGRLIGYGRYFCVPGYKRRITVFWQLLILVYTPQIDVLVLVCSGKYLLILDSYRSLYESNELMDMGLNTRNKSVKNKTECRLLDYRVIFLKKTKKLRISANSRL